MIANTKTRFGLVGAGAIAQSYLQAFQQSNEAELVGVADMRIEAAQTLANSVECASFSSELEMVEAATPDAVIVCTPPATHADICIGLVERGIHVLCEKPLTVSSETAMRMIDAAEKAEVKLSMASKFRHVSDVIRAKAIVSSGILGEIMLLENVFAARVDMSTRWNADPAISGGGVLIDNGTHSVDILRYLLGPITELHAVEGKRIQPLKVEDTVRIFVRTSRGEMGSIDLSWSMSKEQPYYLSIYGSEGTVLVGWQESKYRRSSDQDWIVFGKGYDKINAFKRQIDEFALAIRGEQALAVTPQDALASVQVIEAAYEALRHSGWIPVNGEADESKFADRLAKLER